MYSILNEEAEPVTALRTGVPMRVEDLIAKCLRKKTTDRYSSAGEVATDLRLAMEPPLSRSRLTTPGAANRPRWKRPELLLPWVLFAVTALSLLVALRDRFEADRIPSIPYRTYSISVDPPPSSPVISPDGRKIAYIGEESVWVLDLERRNLQGPRKGRRNGRCEACHLVARQWMARFRVPESALEGPSRRRVLDQNHGCGERHLFSRGMGFRQSNRVLAILGGRGLISSLGVRRAA